MSVECVFSTTPPASPHLGAICGNTEKGTRAIPRRPAGKQGHREQALDQDQSMT